MGGDRLHQVAVDRARRRRHPRQRHPARHRSPATRIESVYGAKAAARGVDYAVVLEEALAKTSLRRLVTADDIANTIVFLCSPAGANISGQAIAVDADVQALV